MTRLVRAELFKLRTTNTWWLFGLAALVTTAAAVAINCVQAHSLLKPFDEYVRLQSHGRAAGEMPPERLARLKAEWILGHDVVGQAASIFTSGQFLGVLFVSLLGILLITNEYQHQTATTTFLLTPHRSTVVAAKLAAGVLIAALFWLGSTVINLVSGAVFLRTEGYGSQLGHWDVVRALLLNLGAYAIWAVFGIGFGALIRSQLGATVTASVLYLVGTALASGLFDLINTYLIQKDWVLTAQVIVPAVASEIMISPTKTFTQSPPQWVGAAVLIGYGLIAGAIGTWILRRRDVS
jgi:ABC-2 type transport system permease protein